MRTVRVGFGRSVALVAVCALATVGLTGVAFAAPGTTPTLTAPTDGATVGGAVALTATSTAANVQFVVDGVAFGTQVAVSGGSATTTWPTYGLTNASHTITAKDCDSSGQPSGCGAASTAVNVTVSNSAAVLTAPTAGETTGAATTLTATVAGGGVEFVVDGVDVGFDGVAPYTYAVINLAEGAHTAATRACDATGAVCTGPSSAPTSFTVKVLHPQITAVSPSPFSANGDGRRDSTRATFTLPESQVVSWAVVVKADQRLVRGSTGLGTLAAGTHSFLWNGLNNSGARVGDGVYTVQIHTSKALTGTEVARGVGTRDVRVDNTAPVLSNLTGSGETFYPYPDTFGDTWTPHVHIDEAATLYLDIFNPSGVLVRRISATHTGGGTPGLTWNGKSTSGTIVAAGTYAFRFWAQDTAGNRRFSANHSVIVSAKKLVAKVATITLNGNQGTFYTSDQSCTGYSYNLSDFPTGVWLENHCSDVQVIYAQFTVALPGATRYSSISLSSYGNTVSAPEHVGGAFWNYSGSSWDVGPLVALTHNSVNATSSLGSVTATGHVSSSHAKVAFVVPSIDPPEDYDLARISVTVHYQVLS